MPKFVVTDKKTGKEEVYNLDKETIALGRTNTSDIELAANTVSRNHAEIVKAGNDFFLVDLESGNGTFLNSRKLKPHEKNLLRSADRIRIEDFEIQFVLLSPSGGGKGVPEENTDSDIIEIKMIKKVLKALDTEHHPSLEVTGPPCEGRKVFFTDDIAELVIGRDSTCPLVIDSPSVSRRHAVLHKKWGGVTVTDLGSKNGTFVNNQKVQEKLLKDGDMVMLGTVKALFRNPGEINLDELSREYAKEDSLLTPKTKPAPSISKEAKATLAEKEPEKEKESQKKEMPPSIPLPQDFARFLSRFSTLELTLMGAGALIFLVAFFSLLALLF
ncbi:MAG: FHA domain-containing protein [Deltaproteobacteria bacterium]|nr:FHA domain-containing protein [Deltaproteobacteria bacterium]